MFNTMIEQMAKASFIEYEHNGYSKDEEGFYICPNCGTRASRLTNDDAKMHVPSACECQKAKNKAEEEAERKYQSNVQRKECFISSEAAAHTFENDNGSNPELTRIAQNYVEHFEDFRKNGKGLLIFGDVGHGKTYITHCIANDLIDKGYHVKQTTFPRLEEETIKHGRFDTIDRYMRNDLVIIDDLGVERATNYMNELVYSVIDTAYVKSTPLIITTNYTADELKKPSTIENERIFDRLIERCHPIEVVNPLGSQRRAKFKNDFFNIEELLDSE